MRERNYEYLVERLDRNFGDNSAHVGSMQNYKDIYQVDGDSFEVFAERFLQANLKRFRPRIWTLDEGRTINTGVFDRNDPKAIDDCIELLNCEFLRLHLAGKNCTSWRHFIHEGCKLEQRASYERT